MLTRCGRLVTAASLSVVVLGCASDRRAAEAELQAAEDALLAVGTDARDYVAEQWNAVNEAMDSARARIERRDYAEARVSAREARTTAAGLPDAMASMKADLGAKWTVLNDSVPPMMAEIKAQLTQLSGARRLPDGVSRSQITKADSTLLTLNRTWTEAVQAFDAGKVPQAVGLAQSVHAGALELMQSVGMRRG